MVKPRVVNETGEGAGGRQDTRASVSCAPRRAPARLVVAGFGMVGFKLVERLAALDALWRYDVTVVGEERHPAYDRVRLTEWLDHRDPDRLALARPGWAEALGIRVVTGMRVASIDRERRLVRAAGGAQIGYDRLVLATGSAPFVPPIEGADHDGVFVYRTLDDLLRLRRRAGRVRRAVVLGGGLLGLEAADALRRLGLDVVLVEAAPHLMSRQLDADAAARLEARVRETGVRTITGARVRRIEPRGDGLALTIDGGAEPLDAGVVVIAAGVRPRDELARNAGLEVAPGPGGIVVDDELRTTDPAIHAIGECASHAGVVYGLAAPGFRMAETLAETLAGRRGRFRGYTPAVRLRLIGIDVWSLGDQGQPGTRVTWSGDGACRQVTMRGRRMVAASAVGPWAELGFTQDLIRRGRAVAPWVLHRFFRTGSFEDPTARRPVAEWPASAMVCNCLEITRGALSAASAAGCATVDELIERTGASRVCGSCRPLLAELAGGGPAAAGHRWREGLLFAALAAALLALLIAASTPFPLAARLRGSFVWDVLYRDGWWRQATGYGALACALIGTLGYSVRKHWPRARWGSLAAWRMAHGAVGALALLVLVAHTGMRIGSGFNRVLLVTFLAAAALGSAAAVGLEHRHARVTSWLHLLAVWPLPALLVIHILSAYFF